MESLASQIRSFMLDLDKCKNNKKEKVGNSIIQYSINNDELVYGLLEALYNCIHYEVYDYLSALETDEAETKIRNYIKAIIKNVLPIITLKMNKFKNAKSELNIDYQIKYLEMYDNFYAICSFRVLEMFAQYMEWDLSNNDKILSQNLNCFHGFWYYANKMVLDKTVKRIMKQCPTGYGKSYTDIVLIAYIFGLDYNTDVMKVTGNTTVVTDASVKLVKYMCKERYAKVFPYYKQFNCDERQVFSICQIGGRNSPTRLTIRGSRKGISFLMCNKETPFDGGRYMWHFYDDVTRSLERASIAQHEKDFGAYRTQWEKRKYDDSSSFEVFSGTTYHIQDFLSEVKRLYGGEKAVVSPVNRFTKVCDETKSVFISVPKLDFSVDPKGVCTFPQKYSTEEARRDMMNDPETFWAMDMQEPRPIEGSPFTYQRIQTYSRVPHELLDGVESCYAVLDPARTGNDFVSMPIFLPIEGKHYLIDALYQMRPMKELYNDIIEKIVKHHITKFHIENNTDTSLKVLLVEMLNRRGVSFCDVTESYTWKKKDEKIFNSEASIKNNMVFPEFGLYATGSEVGTFMKWFTGYSYSIKNAHDDAPDSVAQYNERYIDNNEHISKVTILRRKTNFN